MVRVEVLELIARFYIPLGSHIRSCLQYIVLALLPALEEESSESNPRSLAIFASIAECVGPKELLQKMWGAMLLSNKHRMAVVNYFSKIQPKAITYVEAESFCAGNTSLVVDALCCALDDHQTLVVRGTLDIIFNHFPVHCSWLTDDQKIKLAIAGLSVLTRRDMSLTRRVFVWLFANQSSYSEEISQESADLVFRSITVRKQELPK